MDLKIMSSNVKGLADPVKRKQVFNYFRNKKLDVIFIQESHSSKNKQKIWRSQWGGSTLFSHGETNARGAAILFSKDLGQKILWSECDPNGRYVIAKVKIDQTVYLFCNVYAPNLDEPQFFEKILNLIKGSDNVDITIWGGDFNKIMDRKDKLGTYQESRSTSYLQTLVDDEGWTDAWRYLNPEIKQFTYFTKKPLTGSRLDYFLIPDGNMDFVQDCSIVPGYLSDHSFVYIQLKVISNIRGRGSWKINNSVLEKKEYIDAVNEIIDSIRTTKFGDPSIKWDALKNSVVNFTQEYSQQQASDYKIKVQTLEKKIASLGKKLAMINLSSTNAVKLIQNINAKLDPLQASLAKETAYKI